MDNHSGTIASCLLPLAFCQPPDFLKQALIKHLKQVEDFRTTDGRRFNLIYVKLQVFSRFSHLARLQHYWEQLNYSLSVNFMEPRGKAFAMGAKRS
ncbi:MAG: hypothetical protein F6K41_26260 [Symploca sp. SIO3E6]|nr:hypothetical protein [Caldora sp. SIO3E6]